MGFMSDEQMIYIDPEDDLTNVRTRLEGVESRYVTLVIPPQTQLRSHVAWKLLHARARELGKDILIVSADPQIRSVAQAVKFRVANSLEAAQDNKPRPATRPGRSNAPTKGRSTLPRNGTRPSRQLPPAESWSPARPGSSSQSLEGRRPGRNADDSISDRDPAPRSVNRFGADERRYGRSYDFQVETPSIRSLADQPIEDPDLLLEDFHQAEDIREAASQGGLDDADRAEQSSLSPLSATGKRAEAYRITPRSQADDPFAYMDEKDTGTGVRREQQAQAGLHNYDTNQHPVEDISEFPHGIEDSAIEFEGDQGDFVIHSERSPKARQQHSWTEPTPDDEEDFVGPARTYGVRPRGSRSGQVPPLPRQQNVESDDALPPIEERPTQTGRPPRTSKPLAGSRSDALSGRVSKPLAGSRSNSLSPRLSKPLAGSRSDAPSGRASKPMPGSRSDAFSPRTSKPLAGSRSDSLSPRLSKPLTGSRSDALAGRASQPMPGSRSNALSGRVSKPLAGSRSDALRAAPLESRTEMQAPPRPRPRPSQPLTPQEVARVATPAATRGKPPANVASTRPRTQLPPPPKRRGLSGGTLFVAAIILLFLLVAVIAYLVPTADVRVGLPGRAYTHPTQLIMTSGHATAPNMVTGTTFTHDMTLKGTGTASGSTRVSTNSAQGLVIFTNNSSTVTADIPTGVVVTTATGVQFVTTSNAVAPTKGGAIQNFVEVPVQATKPGEAGNVPQASITTISDDSISLIARSSSNVPTATIQLTVVNPDATSGGGAGNAPQVKQQDLDSAQAALSSQLQANFMSWLKPQIASGDVVGLPTKSEKLVNQPQVGQVLPSGTNSFPLELQGTYSVLVLHNADLQNATRGQLNTALGTDKTFAGYTMANGAPITIANLKIKNSGANQNSQFYC